MNHWILGGPKVWANLDIYLHIYLTLLILVCVCVVQIYSMYVDKLLIFEE